MATRTTSDGRAGGRRDQETRREGQSADRGSPVPRTLVDLRETDLGDADLAELHIVKIDDIWYLNLSDTRVTNDGLAGIKGLSHLRRWI